MTKTLTQAIAAKGLDETAEVRKWATRSKHGWKRGKDIRVFPGQPQRTGVTVGYSELEHRQGLSTYGYPVARAQNDLFRIAAAPDAMAEYIAIYLTRNHLKA